MKRPVCVKCEREMIMEIAGVTVAEMYMKNTAIYKLWNGDLWRCLTCDMKIVSGYAGKPFAEAHNSNCQELVDKAVAAGKHVIYDKEYVS